MINTALDAGCNYFDSAEAYNNGDGESTLGQAIKSRREEAIIGTKILPSNFLIVARPIEAGKGEGYFCYSSR